MPERQQDEPKAIAYRELPENAKSVFAVELTTITVLAKTAAGVDDFYHVINERKKFVKKMVEEYPPYFARMYQIADLLIGLKKQKPDGKIEPEVQEIEFQDADRNPFKLIEREKQILKDIVLGLAKVKGRSIADIVIKLSEALEKSRLAHREHLPYSYRAQLTDKFVEAVLSFDLDQFDDSA